MTVSRRQFIKLGTGSLISLWARSSSARADDCAEEAAPRAILTWGTNGHGEGQFDIPIAIAVSRNDELWITDFRQSNADAKGRLQKFDAGGRYLGGFETEPMPGGLAFDPDALVYATHMMRHKVVVYDSTGRQVREFGKQGTEPGEFQQPGGIAFGPDGSLYVADQVNRRVQRLTAKGEPISAWGAYGTKPGEFGGNVSAASRVGGPHFLAFNSQGDLYTTEGSVGRIQKFTSAGRFLSAFGDNQQGPGHFGSPKGLQGPIAITVDKRDRLWITATNHYVQQFSGEGKYLRGLGGEGDAPGQFRTPHGLAFDSQQNLYVLDSRNSRVQKLAI